MRTLARPASLDDIRRPEEAEYFPQELLGGASDALVLFAAGFYGRQDAVWFADAGLQATCVDIDREHLNVMRELYPADWTFVCNNVFSWAASMAARGEQWDIVSLDPHTGMFSQVAGLAPLWVRLARQAVIVGTGLGTLPEAPPGWRALSPLYRSDYRGGVCWASFTKEAA